MKLNEELEHTAQISPFTYGNCWGMWVINTLMIWTPMIIVDFLPAGLWRDILWVVAGVWLFSGASTARFTPIARNFPIPLFLGGLGIFIIGVIGPDRALSAYVFFFVVLVYLLTPGYAKFAEANR